MADEGYPGKGQEVPVPHWAPEKFRNVFDVYAARLAKNKAVREEIGARGPSDDTFRHRLEVADADDREIAAAATALDSFLPHPQGEDWLTVMDERADAIREQWEQDADG